MKKLLSNKQFAIIVLVLAAMIVLPMIFASVAAPSVAQAYDVDSDDIFYTAANGASTDTETFSYATRTVDTYSVNPTYPQYYNGNSSITNTCANVAGANIIGFYDRYFENLIPNSVPGYYPNELYYYYPMFMNATANQAVINDLYNRMQTNVVKPGSTQTQYNNGLSAYIQAKGYNSAFSSVMTNGAFDLNKAKAQFQSGKPISLFLSGYGFTDVTDSGTSVTLKRRLYDGNHIAVAFGYKKVDYFDGNGNLIRSYLNLRVATGYNGIEGYYIVNNYGSLNDAEAISIY